MGRYTKRDYKVRCDISGAIVYASECRMQWNGLFVQKHLWSPRQPQDRVASVKESMAPPVARPQGTDQFISANDVTADDL